LALADHFTGCFSKVQLTLFMGNELIAPHIKNADMTKHYTSNESVSTRRSFLKLSTYQIALVGAMAFFARLKLLHAQTKKSNTSPSPESAFSNSLAGSTENYVGLHYLGATYFDYYHGAAAWPAVTLKSLRLWDIWDNSPLQQNKTERISWGDIHRGQNVYDFSLLDRYIKLAKSKGVSEFVYTLGYTPKWSRSDGANNLPPTDHKVWDEFIRVLVTRYRGIITAYGIWNEPNAWPYNSGYYWAGTPAELANMGSRLYKIVKKFDPNALVLSPETQGNGSSWMKAYMSAPGGKDFDIYAVHYYGDTSDYLAELRRYHEGHQAVRKEHWMLEKPMWNTEFGWQSQHGGSCSTYMSKMTALNKKLGIAKIFWYAYDAPTGRLANPPVTNADFTTFKSITR
jgi:hypothetical protein